MLAVTGGINTHRGALWALGLLSAAIGAGATSTDDATAYAAMLARIPDPVPGCRGALRTARPSAVASVSAARPARRSRVFRTSSGMRCRRCGVYPDADSTEGPPGCVAGFDRASRRHLRLASGRRRRVGCRAVRRRLPCWTAAVCVLLEADNASRCSIGCAWRTACHRAVPEIFWLPRCSSTTSNAGAFPNANPDLSISREPHGDARHAHRRGSRPATSRSLSNRPTRTAHPATPTYGSVPASTDSTPCGTTCCSVFFAHTPLAGRWELNGLRRHFPAVVTLRLRQAAEASEGDSR